MNSDWQKDYPLVLNLNETDLDENSSLKKMLHLIGENKRVLDVGCATGYLARLLTKRECQVTGVEVNQEAAEVAKQYCEQVVVADLDFVSLPKALPNQTFDVVVFGDVLEHLRDPWRVLEETRQLLQPEGYVVVSVPNIAHGAIRLALLEGRFEYMRLGILDDTHLRFFTRKTVEELFERSGYFIDVIDRTKLPIFSDSSWVPHIERNAFDNEIVQLVEQEGEADTFQFVVRAFLSIEGKYAALNKQYSKLVDKLNNSQLQLQQTQAESAHFQSQLQHTQAESAHFQAQLQHTQAESAHIQAQLQLTQAE